MEFKYLSVFVTNRNKSKMILLFITNIVTSYDPLL